MPREYCYSLRHPAQLQSAHFQAQPVREPSESRLRVFVTWIARLELRPRLTGPRHRSLAVREAKAIDRGRLSSLRTVGDFLVGFVSRITRLDLPSPTKFRRPTIADEGAVVIDRVHQ